MSVTILITSIVNICLMFCFCIYSKFGFAELAHIFMDGSSTSTVTNMVADKRSSSKLYLHRCFPECTAAAGLNQPEHQNVNLSGPRQGLSTL